MKLKTISEGILSYNNTHAGAKFADDTPLTIIGDYLQDYAKELDYVDVRELFNRFCKQYLTIRTELLAISERAIAHDSELLVYNQIVDCIIGINEFYKKVGQFQYYSKLSDLYNLFMVSGQQALTYIKHLHFPSPFTNDVNQLIDQAMALINEFINTLTRLYKFFGIKM